MPQPFLESEAAVVIVVALFITGALLRVRPAERTVFLNTLWVFLIGMIGLAVAAFLDTSLGVRVAFRIVAAVGLIRLLGFAAFRLLLPFAKRSPPRIVEDLAIVIVYALYGLVELRVAGVDLSSLITTSAILTAVVAFAMQDTLGNLLGGIAVQLDHSVQVGDWVRVDQLVGRVLDIRWRSTLLETSNWETVVIPNSQLMKNRVAILGRRDGAPKQWRRTLAFMVDPGVPPARVISTVVDDMREVDIPNVARMPPASCILSGFEQGNLGYQLRYYLTELGEDDSTDSAVRVHLFASLQRAGIRISEPQRTVHAVSRDEAHAETVRKRELGRRLELLRGVDLFGTLSQGELEEIAERLQYAPFARGDVIMKQGDSAHWLYIVAFGEAEVFYEATSGKGKLVGELKPGQFFGEMGLFAGDARHATVVAKTDVECYRLDRAAVQGLLLSRPEIAGQVSRIVTSRRDTLEEVRSAFAAVRDEKPAANELDLLSRIRNFFGLRA